MSSKAECARSLETGVQICGEVVIPGGSNLIKGDFVQAGIHAGLGLVARALLGFPGLLLVSTNSLSKALTDRHLYEHWSGATEQAAPAAPVEASPTITSQTLSPVSEEENKKAGRTRSSGKAAKAPRSRPAKKKAN